jgi:CDGSH-type Zn-finger protein
MSRLVRHDAKGPAIIDTGHGQVLGICQCGLSSNKPFCDGAHGRTKDEKEHAVYVYDDQKNRVEVTDLYPPVTKKLSPP